MLGSCLMCTSSAANMSGGWRAAALMFAVVLAALGSQGCGGKTFAGRCEFRDGFLLIGESVKDDCNSCTCRADGLACTQVACGTPSPLQTCGTDAGETLRHGDEIEIDCESCTCTDGRLQCEAIDDCTLAGDACQLADGRWLDAGDSIASACGRCECDAGQLLCGGRCDEPCRATDGRFVEDGHSIDIDCNTCTCADGELSCTHRTCAVGDECHWEGNTYASGETFQVDCNDCVCADGFVSCDARDCESTTCAVGNETYADGAAVPSETECERCVCEAGSVACVNIACDGSCDYDGVTYPDGQAFDDGCNACECEDGVVSCTERACPSDCEYDGRVYADGEQVDTGRDCQTCSCADGALACVEIGCDVCELDAKTYDDGEIMPSDGPCRSCSCVEGQVRCDFVACPDPQCEADQGGPLADGTTIDVDGATCECTAGRLDCEMLAGSCEVRGQLYLDGASVPDPNSCNTCRCEQGVVSSCTEINCPILGVESCQGDSGDMDERHDTVAINDGYLTIDVTHADGCTVADYRLCFEPVEASGNDPETVLHLERQDAVQNCDEPATQTLVFDLYALSEAGYDEVFLQLGRHRLLYVAP